MSRRHHTLLKVALGADIDDNDTAITFEAPLKEYGEDNIATISGGDIIVFRCENEILHLTAYTSAASSGTFLRGQEGSTATAHPEGAILRHVVTDLDWSAIDDAIAAAVVGFDWKASVRACATSNVNISNGIENGDTIDGVTLVTGNRVLLTGQTAGAENGIYVVPASGAASRATDADTSAEVTSGLAVTVTEGTANGNAVWLLITDDPIVLGTTALVFNKIPMSAGSGSVATDSIFDAKGDLPVGTGADTAAKLPVGSNGLFLTADSGEATGLKWAAPSGSSPNGWKDPVRVATAAVLPNSPTYSAGVYTAGANAAIVVDGVSLAANERVLVKDQATGSRNGIYTVTTVGSGAAPWVLTRATDFDTSAEVVSGVMVRVSEGTVNAGTAWYLSTTGTITLDTTTLTFTNLLAVAALATRISPSSDTYIDSSNATTNYDTATALVIGSSWASTSSCRRALLTFDVSALAGKTIRSAKIRLVTVTYGADIGGGRCLGAREMLRAYSPTQATWNVYSTGNNWGTAGAKNTTSDISTAIYGNAIPPNNQVDAEVWIDVSQLLRKRIGTDGDTTFRCIIGTDATAGDNNVQFASIEHATTAYRPYMDVIYTS